MSALGYTQGHDVCCERRKCCVIHAKSYATFLGKVQYLASSFLKNVRFYSLPNFIESLSMENALISSCGWIYV